MKVRALAIALVLAALGGISTGCGGSRRGSAKQRGPLAARASASGSVGTAPLEVRFRDASSGAVVDWRWSFGDGSGSRDVAPIHVFSQPGRYSVTLEVKDVHGATSTASVATIMVAVRGLPAPGAQAGGASGTTAPGATPAGSGSNVGSPYWYQGDAFGNPLKTHSGEEAALAHAVLVAVNGERATAGLPPLRADDQALRAAKVHAEDMHGRRYFGHLSPEGWTPEDRLRMTGASGVRATAENIFAGPPTAAMVVSTWMASPGHRANILSASLTHLGVGVRAAGGDTLVVAVFTAR